MGYTASEAARLVSWANQKAGGGPISENLLREWVDEGVGSLCWTDLWDGEKFINFPALISLRLIFRLHSQAVPIKVINDAGLWLRRELGVEWPFACSALWNYSDDPFLADKGGPVTILSKALFLRCSDQTDGLEFNDDGLVCAWMPAEDIRIDPLLVSGSPCLAGTRIPTWILPGMVEGGDSIEEIMNGYGLSEERVRKAIDWERRLAAIAI